MPGMLGPDLTSSSIPSRPYTINSLIRSLKEYEDEIDFLWKKALPIFKEPMKFHQKKAFISQLRDLITSDTSASKQQIENKLIEGTKLSGLAFYELRDLMERHLISFRRATVNQAMELIPHQHVSEP